ncbi:hypothetical protein EN794_041490 [Mesorhizobium sp. M00.F.Ca.ET.151.01.1.1]|nr:hypothetical protein EN794_041490 [Mesorhizobium sp. M00.F.Ca.ET.151.01.1.1]
MPAGILSPYSDGERRVLSSPLSPVTSVQEGRRDCDQPFLPVTMRGEMPGRAMRGGADIGEQPNTSRSVARPA